MHFDGWTLTQIKARIRELEGRRPPGTGPTLVATLEAGRRQKAWDVLNPGVREELQAFHDEWHRRMDDAREQARIAKAHAEAVSNGAGERSLQAAQTPRETEALQATRDWWMGESWLLLLHGAVGTGKTVAASWLLSEAVRCQFSVEFRKVGSLMRVGNWEGGPAELERLKRVAVLVLDDAGAESLTDHGRGLLVELLDARYEAIGSRTVMTSNLPREQLASRFGQRIWDRIGQGGLRVELGGASMRATP